MSEYTNFSDKGLLKEIELRQEKLEGISDTVFMRMVHELQIYQMELELHNRELRKAQLELEEARGRYDKLYDCAPFACFTFDSHGAIIEANQTAAALLGMDRLSLPGTPIIDYVVRHERAEFLSYVRASISGECKNNAEFELELAEGKSIRVQATRMPVQFVKDTPDVCCMLFTDVTERRIAELKLRLTSKVLENTQEGIMLTDARQRIVAVNQAYLKMTGYESEELIGYTPSKLKSGLHDEQFYKEMNISFVENDGWQGEIWNRRKDGDIYPLWGNIKVIRKNNGDVDCYIGIFSDISNQEAMKQKLKELAYYDELTGLANRSLLYDRAQLALAHSRRSGASLAVLFLDLDRFRDIIDMHGLRAGDYVLKEAAERLTYCMRQGDTLGRLGGGEFVAILPDIVDFEVPSLIAARMLNVLEKPFFFEEKELPISTNIGISISPKDGDEWTVLLKKADAAMYSAKKTGRCNYQYYDAITSQ